MTLHGIRKLIAFGLFEVGVVVVLLYADKEAWEMGMAALCGGLAGFYGVNGWVHKTQGNAHGNTTEVR